MSNLEKEADRIFNAITKDGKSLWDDQQSAFKAGFFTGVSVIKSPRRHLKWPAKWRENQFVAICRTTSYSKKILLTDEKEKVNCIKCLDEIKRQEKGVKTL